MITNKIIIKNKRNNLKNILFIFAFLFLFIFLFPSNRVKAVGEDCENFEDCPPNNMCISTSIFGGKKCYPKIDGGCNNNDDCSKIEEKLDITGSFCDLSRPVTGFPGSCYSNNSAPKTTTDDGCTWRIEKIVPGAPGTFQGGCYSTEEQENYNRCSSISKPNESTGDTIYCCCQKEPAKGTTKTPDLNPLGQLQIKIPGINELAQKYPIICDNENDKESCKIPWIAIYIYAIYNYLLGIGGVLAAVALMIGGVIWLVSAGNASRVSQAKSWITGSVTGIFILLTSYVLLYQINPELVGMKYIELKTINEYDIPVSAQISAPLAGPSSHGVPLYYQCSDFGKKILYHDKNKKCPDLGTSYIEKYGTQTNPKPGYKGSPNLCTSGCGLVSTFMAVNKYKPEQNIEGFTRKGESLGARGINCNGSKSDGLILLAQDYGLKSGYTSGKESIIKKLDEGCVVVISLKNNDDKCAFTNGGHFIVLTGWRERNNLIADVNDPQGNIAYPYKGQCTGERSGNPTPCKTWISLNNWGGCSLNQQFYVCGS